MTTHLEFPKVALFVQANMGYHDRHRREGGNGRDKPEEVPLRADHRTERLPRAGKHCRRNIYGQLWKVNNF